ncbi:MAG: ATP-grasp domain-containing protein [Aquimonas sp.]|nr:ATP-grasp domain-containing protein [Aquimonas sp.]
MPFASVLIANRGEIACRIIRTCRRLGIRTVAVYSDADASAQHARLADVAVHIGGSSPRESYLRPEAILEAARATGAQAIHPGYGFLSENADFADAVVAAGLVFIGPSGTSMRKMGSKAGAKDLMSAAGVPVVPGYTGEDQSRDRLAAEAERIGYPLMIKAAHGGGGKGMRIVRATAEFLPNLESCQREAANAFGRDRVLLERYVETPRHIEIQVFGDAHGQVIHLNERECSAQRRYQKVIEESPSPFLTPERRAEMGAAAVLAARAIDYVNAGTVEFIVGPGGDFYFMEINTRLQVEHPVTEEVTGLDLVEWQLRVAAGERLPKSQEQIASRGHAIEVRLYAEDPEAGFLPGSGRIERLQLPQGLPGVRIDGGVVEGDTVSVFYDPMIAKLIVHADDRPQALARMADALARSRIEGPKSNIEFLERLIRHPAVVDATIDTGYLDRHLDQVLPGPRTAHPELLAAAASALLLGEHALVHEQAVHSPEPDSPWALADSWRGGHNGDRLLVLDAAGGRVELHVSGNGGSYDVRVGDVLIAVRDAQVDGDSLSLRINGELQRFLCQLDGARALLHDGRARWSFQQRPSFEFEGEASSGDPDRLRAPMPGRIVLVSVAAGDAVESEQVLLVMEAMKMELSLRAPRTGVVEAVQVSDGDFVEADAVLLRLEPAE